MERAEKERQLAKKQRQLEEMAERPRQLKGRVKKQRQLEEIATERSQMRFMKKGAMSRETVVELKVISNEQQTVLHSPINY